VISKDRIGVGYEVGTGLSLICTSQKKNNNLFSYVVILNLVTTFAFHIVFVILGNTKFIYRVFLFASTDTCIVPTRTSLVILLINPFRAANVHMRSLTG
jgi:hypothetical protein